MNPEQYCYDKAAPTGSPFYFSVRKLDSAQRDVVVAIQAVYLEIEEVTLEYEDISVAQAKLNWWRDEVIKIQEGQPEHPVAIVLQKNARNFSLPVFQLIELIDGLEQNLSLPTFQTFEDIVIHIMRTAGVREKLIAVGLQNDGSIPTELIYQLTLALEMVNNIQHLHRYVRKGLIYFSQNELQQFQVSEAELHKLKTTSSIRNLLKFQAEKVERSFEMAKQQWNEYPGLSNLVVRCEMARVILREIQKSDYCVLENFITITPLRCWWIALLS